MSDARLPWRLVLGAFLLCIALPVASREPLEVSLPDLNGDMHPLDQYRGKWVVVNYWSTACFPCLEEIPELNEFHERHKGRDAVVVGVNHEQIPLSGLRQFISTASINYPVLRSDPSADTPFGVVQMLPTTFIISPDGRSIVRRLGAVTAAQLEAYIESETSGKIPAEHTGK